MKKLLYLGAVSVLSAISFAAPAQSNSASARYDESRRVLTNPPYGLRKVESLIKQITFDAQSNRRLAAKTFNSLTFDDKFTYVMIHGEEFSQNCSGMPPLTNEQGKIFSYTPSPFGDETVWSDTQMAFLKNNRSKVIGLIRACMKSGRVGLNLKEAIEVLDAKELIPDLIAAHARNSSDNDIMTVLCLLMKDGNYKPFESTPIYVKLYGSESNYHTFVQATASNEKIILTDARALSQSSKK